MVNGFRSTEVAAQYEAYLRKNHDDKKCVFCDVEKSTRQILHSYKYFLCIANDFPYSNWDDGQVIKHHLLIPKRHVTYLDQLHHHEQEEYISIIATREREGYNTYTRTNISHYRSVSHYHTHLLMVDHSKIST
jgi:diadenosine tetraphosphate (Ap4A) HIT family hydrolase